MPYKDKKKNMDYQREYQAQWRKDNPDQRKAILKKSDVKRENTPKRKLEKRTAHQRKLIRSKLLVFEMYGKVCSRCSEDRFELLCIDHINGIGVKNRRKETRGSNIYEFLCKQPHQPDKYQVLCHNCNMAKEFYNITPGEVDYMPWEYWQEISKRRYK